VRAWRPWDRWQAEAGTDDHRSARGGHPVVSGIAARGHVACSLCRAPCYYVEWFADCLSPRRARPLTSTPRDSPYRACTTTRRQGRAPRRAPPRRVERSERIAFVDNTPARALSSRAARITGITVANRGAPDVGAGSVVLRADVPSQSGDLAAYCPMRVGRVYGGSAQVRDAISWGSLQGQPCRT